MDNQNQEIIKRMEEIYREFLRNIEKLHADYRLKINEILEEIKQDKIKKCKEEINKIVK